MITMLEQDKGQPLGTGVYLQLKCRPRVPDILRCHIVDPKLTRLKPRAYDIDRAEPDPADNLRTMNIIKVPFEIKFNERGIDSYIVEETDPPLRSWSLNMAKLIANQLSIGTDLSDEMKSNYRAIENFTIGECDTIFQVTRQPTEEIKKEDVTAFELVPLEKLGKFVDESIEVVKKRNIQDCLRCVDVFFGTRYNLGLVLRDVLTKLVCQFIYLL